MNKLLVLSSFLIFITICLLNLKTFPIFEDEGQYLLLASQIVTDPTKNFFIYLQSGLMPLFGWVSAIFIKIIGDSLVAGRLVNVLLSSTLILWGIKISKLYQLPATFNIIFTLLLLCSPILILNSRIALLDSTILVFSAWYIYFTLKVLRKGKLKDAVFLSIFLLAAFLTKASAILTVPALLFLLGIDMIQKRGFYFEHKLIAICLSLVAALILGLFTIFANQIISDSGSSSITHLPTREIISKVKINVWLTLHWMSTYYLQLIFPLLSFIVFLKYIKSKSLYTLSIFWLLSTIAILVLTNRFYYPRHILILFAPLYLFSAAILSELPKRLGFIFALVIIFLQIPLSKDIILSPASAHLALEDKFSYFEDYTSGITLDILSQELEERTDNKKTVIWADGSYVLEYGLRYKLGNNPNISFKSFKVDDYFIHKAPKNITAQENAKILIVTNRYNPPNIKDLKLIRSFPVSFRHSQYLYALLK